MNLLISVPRFPFCASTVSMVHESSGPPYQTSGVNHKCSETD